MTTRNRISKPNHLDDIQGFVKEWRAYMAIDKNALDEAIEWQTTAYHRVGEELTHYTSLRDEAKDKIKVVEAEADADIRKVYESGKDKKPTEDAIKKMITLDSGLLSATRDFNDLNRCVAMLANLKDSYHQRRYMVQEMVNLWVGNYFMDNIGRSKNASEVRRGEYDRTRARLADTRREDRERNSR